MIKISENLIALLPPLSLQEEFVPSAALRGSSMGVVARRRTDCPIGRVEVVEQMRSQQTESERQVENLFQSLLSGLFGDA